MPGIEFHTAGPPKHQQLRSHLIAQITDGRLKPGDPIPPELKLAALYGVARSTVRQAMAGLERDGLITRVQGRGTFVHEDVGRRLMDGLDVYALIVPELHAGFYPSLQQSFENTAGRLHHQMIVSCTDNSTDKQGNIILQLMDKQVAGVAIVPTAAETTPAYQIRQLQKAGIPVVLCHRGVEGIEAPRLAIPFRDVGRTGGRLLAERGHRHVAFFTSRWWSAPLNYRNGIEETLTKVGGRLEDIFCGRDPDATLDPRGHEQVIFDVLRTLCERGDRPTAIAAGFDSLAELLYLQLGKLGLRVPDDLALLSVGGTVRNGPLQQRLTCVTIDEVRIGRMAVELLDRMRQGELPLTHNAVFDMPIGVSEGETL